MGNNKTPAKKKGIVGSVAEKVRTASGKAKAKIENRSGAKNGNTVKEGRLELMVTIVNRSKAEYYLDLLQSFDVNMQAVVLGHGTADAKMQAVFGLTDLEKAVIFSVIRADKISDAMNTLEDKFKTIKNGKGIAYTLPLTSVVGKLIYGFLSNNKAVMSK